MELDSHRNNDTIVIGGITYSADMATVLSADQNIASFQLERGVRYIGENAFANCQNLHIVHIPETVIRIEDFAFRDCRNLREVHLPYYMEYISPLAFTLSGEPDNPFYNDIKMCFPKEAFLKFTYMIPQFLTSSDYEDSGLTDDDFESVDGWDMFAGLPVCVNEDELYRMAIKDYWQLYYKTGEETIIDADIQAACESAIELMFTFGLSNLIDEGELVDTRKHQIINNIDDSFGLLMDHTIRDWLNFTPYMRPQQVIYIAMGVSLRMGFIPASTWDNPDDKELYGDGFYGYLKGLYVDVTGGFYNEEVEKNESLKEWYDRLDEIDCEVMLDSFVKNYTESGRLVNAKALKRIVRLCMKKLFHIGYSYGLKYRRCAKHEPCLFSEEEMEGGASEKYFDVYTDAYLEAMRTISKLDDGAFYMFREEYEQRESELNEGIYLIAFPEKMITEATYFAMREMIELRRYYNNRLMEHAEARITVPDSYRDARERFLLEANKDEYVCTDWVISYTVNR